MTSPDPYEPLPEEYRDLMRGFISTARRILEEGKPLQSLFFVGTLEPAKWEPIEIDTSTNEARLACAQHARQVAMVIGANFVVQVSEAWSVPAADVSRIEEVLERYGSVSKYPKRIEVASFVLETREGTFGATLPIRSKPPSKRKRTIGEPSFIAADEAQGRFANILAPSSEGKVLH